MKNFRKAAAVLFTVAFVCVLAFSLVACGNTTQPVGDNSEKTVTLVVGEGESQVVYADYKTNANSLAVLLEELGQKQSDPLVVEGTWSQYGIFLTKVGALVPNGAAGEWISILTSDTKYQDVTDWAVTKTYSGTTVKSATLGATSLPLKDGAVYMFVILVYNG